MINKFIKDKYLYITLIIAVCLFIIGAIFDLNISHLIADKENLFGKVLDGFGSFPIILIMMFISFSFLYYAYKEKKYAIIYLMLFCILQTIAIYKAYDLLNEGIEIDNIFTVLLLSIIEIIILEIIAFFLVRISDKTKLKKYTFYLIVGVLISFCCIQAIKTIMARPRYKFLIDYGFENFKYFFQKGTYIKQQYVQIGLNKDLFKSFPSGHSQGAGTLILFSTLGYVIKPLKKYSNLIYLLSVVYIAILMYSRILNADHFLTDVSFSFIVCVISMIISIKVFRLEKSCE